MTAFRIIGGIALMTGAAALTLACGAPIGLETAKIFAGPFDDITLWNLFAGCCAIIAGGYLIIAADHD
jgi:hypothetical protein